MKKYIIILLSILCLCVDTDLYAQRRNPAKNADLAFGRKQYSEAANLYKKAYKRSRRDKAERARISYQTGECFRLIGNCKRAEPYYKRVLKTDYPGSHPEVYLNAAETFKTNQNFKDAIACYEDYIKAVPDDPRGPLGLETTNLIQEWIENPSRYEITEMKKLNSKNSDFGAMWTSTNYNEIIFTSSRNGATGGEKEDITGQDFTDFWTSKQDRKGDWSTPVNADEGENINTDDSDGAGCMNASYS